MADINNVTNNANTDNLPKVPATMPTPAVKVDTPNAPDFKVNPIAWAKRNNKLTYGNVHETVSDPALNIRFRGGSEVCGIKVEKDTYDLPGMRTQIMEAGCILEPLLISVRADGKKVRIRGNRRGEAADEMAADPNTPKDVLKALSEATPMILVYGLTPAQEQELVEDQTQKPFLRSEIVRHIFALRKSGWGFERIAMLYWETLGRWSGNARKVAEVREITDPNLKREKIKVWLRGSLDNYLIWGHDMGQWMQKQILLSEMKLDGILPTNAEQPYFVTTKFPQKRIGALKKAREADGAKFSALMLIDGTEFQKLAKAYHDEDYGITPAKPKPDSKKMLTRETVTGLRDTYQSNAVRAALNLVLGEAVADIQIRDDFAAIQETKANVVEQYLPRLSAEHAAIVKACLINADPTDFQTTLEALCVKHEEETAAANAEAAPAATAEPESPDTFSLDNATTDGMPDADADA